MTRWGNTAYYFPTFISEDLFKLAFCEKFLIRNRVPTCILTQINIILRQQFFKNIRHYFFVIIICRADKLVVRDIQQLPEFLNPNCHAVNVGLWGQTSLFCLLLNLLAMLIKTCQIVDIVAHQALVASQDIAGNGCIGRSDVELARWVINRRCNVKGLFLCHSFSFPR